MNSCILITSHLNNSSKVEAAHNLVDFLQDKGLPIIFTGNAPIPESLQKKVDWVLYTKENPKANRTIYGWAKMPDIGFGGDLWRFSKSYDYGYAHLLQTYRGFKLAQSLKYEHVIHLNYDIEIPLEEWGKLVDQVKLTPNIVNSWKEEYATNFYTFMVEDFIKIMDKNLHYYINNNPPNIHREDWFCEAFFKWAVDNSNINFHKNKSFNVKGTLESETIRWEYGNLMVSFYEPKNIWIIKASVPSNIKNINFTAQNTSLTAKRVNDTEYFMLPHVEGDYFLKGKFIFNSTKLKETQWIGTK